MRSAAVALPIAWLVVALAAIRALHSLASTHSGELQDGEPSNCCATHTTMVTHGEFHTFYGHDMDAQNPNNVICEPGSDDEGIRCPDACTGPAPAGTPRVRRAIHTLSSEQWVRVVNAMWVMRTVSTPDGVDIYGPFYRDWDFFLLVHGAHGDAAGSASDVTGGSAHFGTWHAAHVLDFETSLLAVDPEIEALPYLDWAAMPVRSELFEAFLGTPSGDLKEFYETSGWKDQSTWSVPGAGWTMHSGRIARYSSVHLVDPTHLGYVDNGPFAHWPITTGCSYGSCITAPGGRNLDTLQRQDGLSRVMERGDDWATYWDDADGFLARLKLNQPPGVFGGLPLPLFDMMRDYAIDLNATQWRDPELAGPVPFVVRNVEAPPEYALVEDAEATATIVDFCLDIGNYIGDLVNCIQGRLTTQTTDLHDAWHSNVGGDTVGIAGPNDPAFWFHHAGVDKVRLQWQHRNRQLRSRAWGYFAKAAFSSDSRSDNSAPVDLDDVIGSPPTMDSTVRPRLWEHSTTAPLFGVGFDRERLMGRADAGMEATVSAPMTNADVLCGDVEALYTYDVIVEEKAKELQEASERSSTRTVAFITLLVALAGVVLLAGPTHRLLRSSPGPLRAVTEEYDMRMNDAAKARHVQFQ